MNIQAILYAFFRGLSALACRLPLRAVLALATCFADTIFAIYRVTPFRHFIQGNLRAAFGPTVTNAWLNVTARSHVRQMAQSIAELLRFPLLDRAEAERRVTFEGWEHVEAAQADGKGLIVLTAHFGNWELMGGAIAHRGLPLHVLVQPPSQQAFDRLFNEFRAMVGVHSWPNSGPASLRPVLRALARNEALGLLADQHGESQDAIVTFFGHAVSAPTGPFFFARRTGAAVVPFFALRGPDGRHVVKVMPRLVPSGDDQADAQRMYALYERVIRDNPDHWLWVHDRWAREHELERAPISPAPAAQLAEARA